MIKSELVQRIASQNPHLYQRDVENILNAILGEIVAAMAPAICRCGLRCFR
jgi:integration host factor subunit beta